MNRFICCLLAFFLLNTIFVTAQSFGPPVYIADPVNMICKYYFAGNAKHYNPRPESYTINIGLTTDFKNQEQACEFFRCAYTNGTVKVDENKKPIDKELCVCPQNTYWDDTLGCMRLNPPPEQITFLQLILKWIIKFKNTLQI